MIEIAPLARYQKFVLRSDGAVVFNVIVENFEILIAVFSEKITRNDFYGRIRRPTLNLPKFRIDPQYIPDVGLGHLGRQNRAVADSGRYKDNISLLQTVTVCAHQIFRPTIVAAVEQLIECMAMQIQLGIGITHIPMGLHQRIGHLQFLIEILKINTFCPERIQDFLHFFRGGRGRKSLGYITNNR
jgi:hypothetical protein